MNIRGVIPALVTPFTADGESVDERALGAVAERCIRNGVHGLLTCGGTGEFPALDHSERVRVLEVTLAQAAQRVPVVAHTGALSTKETIALTAHAARSGAAAVMLGVPFYEPVAEPDAIRHFQRVAEATDLPIMLYSYPYATQFPLTMSFLERLVTAVPRIRYLKDSGSSFAQTMAIAHSELGVDVFSGSDLLSGPALIGGAAGLINGASNVFSREFADMCDDAIKRDWASVAKAWSRLVPALTSMEMSPYVASIKACVSEVVVPCGPVRRPLPELESRETDVLLSQVRALVPSLR